MTVLIETEALVLVVTVTLVDVVIVLEPADTVMVDVEVGAVMVEGEMPKHEQALL